MEDNEEYNTGYDLAEEYALEDAYSFIFFRRTEDGYSDRDASVSALRTLGIFQNMRCHLCEEKECDDHCVLEDVVFSPEEIEDYNWYINTHLLPKSVDVDE